MGMKKWIKIGIILISIIYLVQWNVMFHLAGLNLRYASGGEIILFILFGLPSYLLLNTFLDFLLIISPLSVKLFRTAGKKIDGYYLYLFLVIYLTTLIMTCVFYKQYHDLQYNRKNHRDYTHEVNISTFNTFKDHIVLDNFFSYVFSSSGALIQYGSGEIQNKKGNVMDIVFITPFIWSIRFLFVNVWFIILIIRRIALRKKVKL